MKTDDLIGLLATGAAPVPSRALEQRFAVAMLLGFGAAAVVVLLGYGIRPDLAASMQVPMGWAKFGFAASLAALAGAAALRLARPGLPASSALLRTVLPLAALWAMAAWTLAVAAPDARVGLVMGSSWRSCPFSITALSVPGLVALLYAMRQAAPTRLRWAGAAAGLLSGALATLAYALHCPEMAAPFMAVWYVLGIAVPTTLGALLGPRVLRW